MDIVKQSSLAEFKMPTSFHEIINSRPFKFTVGEAVDGSPSEFTVHEAAIAQLSQPLQTLTKSGPEAKSGRAVWKDVSKETFERFVQYAYTGDYSIPKTQKRDDVVPPKLNGIHVKNTDVVERPDNTETPVSAQPSSPGVSNGRGRVDSVGSAETAVELQNGSLAEKLDDDAGNILNQPTLPTKRNRKKKSKAAALEKAEKEAQEASSKVEKELVADSEIQTEPPPTEPMPVEIITAEPEPELISFAEQDKPSEEISPVLTTDFLSLKYPLLASRNNYEGTCEPSLDFEKEHSYSNSFLSHASLYVLGDVQAIDPLKALALFKLHKTLCTFQLDDNNIGDITDLARYAYSSEEKEFDKGNGGLRGLVCQYMAIHAKELAADTKFMNLLAGGGQIVKDFLRFQLQRIQ